MLMTMQVQDARQYLRPNIASMVLVLLASNDVVLRRKVSIDMKAAESLERAL